MILCDLVCGNRHFGDKSCLHLHDKDLEIYTHICHVNSFPNSLSYSGNSEAVCVIYVSQSLPLVSLHTPHVATLFSDIFINMPLSHISLLILSQTPRVVTVNFAILRTYIHISPSLKFVPDNSSSLRVTAL
jgi:hypothetical protein